MPSPPADVEAPFQSDFGHWARRIIRGSVYWRGLVFFVPILFVFGHPNVGLADPSPSLSCHPLLSLVGYLERSSRPPQPLPIVLRIGRALLKASQETGLPLYMLVAIAQEESSFNPKAVNLASEDYGLFQVHYSFWKKFFRKRAGQDYRSVRREDLMNIEVNTRMASDILAYDLKLSRGDVVEMLGRYSGRIGETQKVYVQNILRFSLAFKRYEIGRKQNCPDS